MQRENLIRKIQALLARADKDRNDNENEREIALRQANAMMAKHNLSMVELSEAEQREELGELFESDDKVTGAVWKNSIFNQIAKLNGCDTIYSPHSKTIHILGHKSRVEITRSMALYVIASITREIPKAWDSLVGKASTNRRSFNTSFGNGAAVAIQENVRNILAARRSGVIDGETLSRDQAMVLVDQDKKQLAEVRQFYRKAYPHTRNGAGSSSRSSAGYGAGKAYGAGISLNTQIGGRSAGLLN